MIKALFIMLQLISVDVAFEGYMNDFFRIVQEEGIDVSHVNDGLIKVRFGTKKMFDVYERKSGLPIIGIAFGTWNDKAIIIAINKSRWVFTSKRNRRMVMYHELLHDVFDAMHDDDGIMSRSINTIDGDPDRLLRRYLRENKHELQEIVNRIRTTYGNERTKAEGVSELWIPNEETSTEIKNH